MAAKNKQAKKSPKGGKVSGWSATMDKAFKKLKKAKVFASSAVAGTKGAFNSMLKLFGAGYSEGMSVWLTIPGNKAERKKHEETYTKAGYSVKNGKVMMQKVSPKDTLRMDKKTGLVNRYRTDARTGKRRKSTVTFARDISELPAIEDNERYIVFFRKGRGKNVTYYPRYYDDVKAMDDDMSSMYHRYTDWQAHVEILH
jgi:hypothetical protein